MDFDDFSDYIFLSYTVIWIWGTHAEIIDIPPDILHSQPSEQSIHKYHHLVDGTAATRLLAHDLPILKIQNTLFNKRKFISIVFLRRKLINVNKWTLQKHIRFLWIWQQKLSTWNGQWWMFLRQRSIYHFKSTNPESATIFSLRIVRNRDEIIESIRIQRDYVYHSET